MKGMIYNTEFRIDGPLLIDHNALDDLHTIIETNFEKISKINDEILEKEVERVFQEYSSYYQGKSPTEIEEKKKEIKERISYSYKKYKEITAELEENKYFSDESLKRLISAPELSKENIKGLKVKYGAKKIDVLIELNPSLWSSCLLIRTSPEDNELSREIFVELRDWAYQNQAPLWQRLWKKIKGFHWMIFFLIIWFSALYIQTPQDIAIKNHKVEAHKLLTNGITNDTLPQAVDLVLKIQSKYVPELQKEQSSVKWLSVLLIVCLLIAIILSFLPTLVIGIGKGYLKIIYWRRWLKLISITIPGLIFTSFFWPKIVTFITKLFNA